MLWSLPVLIQANKHCRMGNVSISLLNSRSSNRGGIVISRYDNPKRSKWIQSSMISLHSSLLSFSYHLGFLTDERKRHENHSFDHHNQKLCQSGTPPAESSVHGEMSMWATKQTHITGWYNPLYTLNNQGFFTCDAEDCWDSSSVMGFMASPLLAISLLAPRSQMHSAPRFSVSSRRKRLYSFYKIHTRESGGTRTFSWKEDVGKEGFSSLEIEMDCRFENFAFDTQVAWFKVSANT